MCAIVNTWTRTRSHSLTTRCDTEDTSMRMFDAVHACNDCRAFGDSRIDYQSYKSRERCWFYTMRQFSRWGRHATNAKPWQSHLFPQMPWFVNQPTPQFKTTSMLDKIKKWLFN